MLYFEKYPAAVVSSGVLVHPSPGAIFSVQLTNCLREVYRWGQQQPCAWGVQLAFEASVRFIHYL